MALFHWILLPGLVLHEFAHLLACLLLGLRVRRVRVRVEEGFVEHEAGGPLRTMLVALAPFLLNTAVAFFLFSLLKGLFPGGPVRGVVALWLGVSAAYYALPSGVDGANIYRVLKAHYKQKIFHNKSMLSLLFWLLTAPVLFPLGAVFSGLLILIDGVPFSRAVFAGALLVLGWASG